MVLPERSQNCAKLVGASRLLRDLRSWLEKRGLKMTLLGLLCRGSETI